MKTILALVLFVVIGFIASRVLYYGPRLRLPVNVVFLTGIEFFFLGLLLGPRVLGLISEPVLENLKPVLYLALGWAGLLFGVQLSSSQLQKVSTAVFRFLAVESALVAVPVGVVMVLILSSLFPELGNAEIFASAAVLGLTAALSSPTIVSVLARLLPSRGPFTQMAKISTALSAVVPLVAFGLLFTLAHPGFFVPKATSLFTGLLWWLFANGLGLVMGFVVTLLIAPRMDRDHRLLLIIGTSLFVGGVCFFLKLSALYTAMIIGVVIGNFSRRRVQLFEQLLTIEKTLYIAFLIVIGAMVNIMEGSVLLLLCVYVGLRLLLKTTVTGWQVGRAFPAFKSQGWRSGLAFSAQGAMALAIALDYALGTTGPTVDVVLTVVALGVVLNEFIGIGLTRRGFVAAGEVVDRGPIRKESNKATESS